MFELVKQHSDKFSKNFKLVELAAESRLVALGLAPLLLLGLGARASAVAEWIRWMVAAWLGC